MRELVQVFISSYNSSLKSLALNTCWPVAASVSTDKTTDALNETTPPTISVMMRGDSSPHTFVEIELSPMQKR